METMPPPDKPSIDLAETDAADSRTCPHCAFVQPSEREVCDRCGIIMDRYRPRPVQRPPHRLPQKRERARWRQMMFHLPEHWSTPGRIARVMLVLLLLGYTVRFVLSPIGDNVPGASFLHLINLPFHEAGHVLFRPLGRFMTSLGGSLFQLMVPLICGAALLLRTRDPFGAAVCAWWFGENFLDLAPYINDARSLVLPLVGGHTGRFAPYGFHDWQFILTETGLIRYDHVMAKAAWLIGTVIMLAGIAWSVYLVYSEAVRHGNS